VGAPARSGDSPHARPKGPDRTPWRYPNGVFRAHTSEGPAVPADGNPGYIAGVDALRAIAFGLAIAAPVGPIALLLIRAGLTRPLGAALGAALGVALADLTYALLALSAGSGLALLLQSHQHLFRVASSAMLLMLGMWLAAGALRRPVSAPAALDSATPRGPGLVQFYLLTLANPLTVLLFVGFSGQLPTGGGLLILLRNALLLFAGSLIVQVSYAGFGAALQRLVKHAGLVRSLNIAGALAVAAFGAYGLWQTA